MSAAGPRLRRETRRLLRLVHLLAHLAHGVLLAHSLLPLLGARRDPRAAHALVRWWMRRLIAILAVHVRLEGQIVPGGTLFVANHVSWLDIPVLRATLDVAFVSKAEVRQWPLVGALAARAGTLFLARGSRDASALIADRMTWALNRRRSIVVFPEGTTSRGEMPHPFHPRLLQAAIRIHAPVQAVALSYPDARGGTHPAAPFVGDDSLIRHLWRLLAEERLIVRVNFCAPLASSGQERRALAKLTHAQITAALGDGFPAPARTRRGVI